jgi:hypothetical protein
VRGAPAPNELLQMPPAAPARAIGSPLVSVTAAPVWMPAAPTNECRGTQRRDPLAPGGGECSATASPRRPGAAVTT